MTIKPHISKSKTAEISPGNIFALENKPENTVSDALISEKILITSFEFNVHCLVERDEWHIRKFKSAQEAIKFCRTLKDAQIYRMFHQVFANVNGREETVARRINIDICELMTINRNALQHHKVQTIYKLMAKVLKTTY